MDYQSLHNKTVVELRKLAKDMGVRVPAGTNKSTLIDMLLEADRAAAQARNAAKQAAEAAAPAGKPAVSADKAAGAGKLEASADKAEAEPAAEPVRRGRKPKAAASEEALKPARGVAKRGRAPKAQKAADPGEAAEQVPAAGSGDAKNAVVPASTAVPVEAAPAEKSSVESASAGKSSVEKAGEDSGAKESPAEAQKPTVSAAEPAVDAAKATAAEQTARPAESPMAVSSVPAEARREAEPAARIPEGSEKPALIENGEARVAIRTGDGAYRPRNGEDALRPAMRPRTPEAARGDSPQHQNARYGRPQGRGVPTDNRPQRYAPDAANRVPRATGNRYARPGDAPRLYDNGQGRGYEAAQNRPYDNRQSGYDGGQNRSYDNRQSGYEGGQNRVYENRQAGGYDVSQNRPVEGVQGRVNDAPTQPRSAIQESAAPEAGVEREAPRQRVEQPSYGGEYRTSVPASEGPTVGEYGEGAGVLEIQPDGYGFLRAENCLPGPNDVYISIAQIRRFCLRNGDYVEGKTRPQREGDRYSAIMYISKVNGESPERAVERPRFEDLVPIYPEERLRLEAKGGRQDLSMRLIDMLAPIGKGQRGMIVSQPKAGKTTLLKKVANAITANYPEVHLIVLLIDERPEEVTDMKRSIDGEVVYSTFDEVPENHTRVSEMVLDRAQRLVEMGKDVVVLMDSITRLARAYNLTITPTGRSLSGGLDPGALFKPKRFFGAARNIENGGSLTIIATALVETGSRMDDIIFEEFKGTGNMELHLDRKLSDRRVFPAIDLLRSGTRREELLLSEDEMNGEIQVRRMLNGRQQEMYEQLIDLMTKTSCNAEFFAKLKGWLAVYEKDGYSLGKP